MEGFGKLLVTFGLTFLKVLVIAYAASYMYRWFVMPLGGPEMSLMHTYGLVYLIRFVTNKTPSYAKINLDKKLMESMGVDRENQFADFFVTVVVTLLSWFAAWGIHLVA